MWVPLRLADSRTVTHYLGVLAVGIAIAMLVPLVTALGLREWDPALDYFLGISVTLALGVVMMLAEPHPAGVNRRQGMLVVALGWLVASPLLPSRLRSPATMRATSMRSSTLSRALRPPVSQSLSTWTT